MIAAAGELWDRSSDLARQVVAGSGDLLYYPRFLAPARAEEYLRAFLDDVPWEQSELVIYGKRVATPRLTAWYGDPGARYTYSGLANEPRAWTPELRRLRDAVADVAGVSFNSALLNRYRDGGDSVSWHADDEPELGKHPVIGSVSLGAIRTFSLRDKQDRKAQASIALEHGSLLIMRGAAQSNFQHAVLKERRVTGERINLTFRVIDGRYHAR